MNASDPKGQIKPHSYKLLDPTLYKYRIGQDLVSWYAARWGWSGLGHTPQEVAAILGLEEGTFYERRQNFDYLHDPAKPRNHPAQMSVRVHALFGHLSEEELRPWALLVLASYRAGVPI